MSQSICNSICKKAIVCASFLALFTAATQAADLTETFSIGGNIQDAAHSGTFTLPDFDPTLGTLEGVDILLTINSAAHIQVYNTADTAVGFTDASLALVGSVTGPGDFMFSTTLSSTLDSGVAQPGLNTYGAISQSNSLSQHIGGSSLDLWQGLSGGLINFSYTKGNPTYQGTDLGSSLFFGGTDTGTGTFKVIYTYLDNQAVPEPSSKFLSVIVACLMGLMWFGRARGLVQV